MKYPLLFAIVASAFAPDLSAQRLTIDLRGAIAAPLSELGGADIAAGFGFGTTLAWRIQPHLHLYGGWDWMRFTSDNVLLGQEVDLEETGYTFGLRFEHPLGATSAMYRLEAGGTYKHVEIEDENGDIVADTDHGLGYELGAGVLLPLGRTWKFVPAVRYRALSRDYTVGALTTSGELRYAAFELGFSRRF